MCWYWPWSRKGSDPPGSYQWEESTSYQLLFIRRYFPVSKQQLNLWLEQNSASVTFYTMSEKALRSKGWCFNCSLRWLQPCYQVATDFLSLLAHVSFALQVGLTLKIFLFEWMDCVMDQWLATSSHSKKVLRLNPWRFLCLGNLLVLCFFSHKGYAGQVDKRLNFLFTVYFTFLPMCAALGSSPYNHAHVFWNRCMDRCGTEFVIRRTYNSSLHCTCDPWLDLLCSMVFVFWIIWVTPRPYSTVAPRGQKNNNSPENTRIFHKHNISQNLQDHRIVGRFYAFPNFTLKQQVLGQVDVQGPNSVRSCLFSDGAISLTVPWQSEMVDY